MIVNRAKKIAGKIVGKTGDKTGDKMIACNKS